MWAPYFVSRAPLRLASALPRGQDAGLSPASPRGCLAQLCSREGAGHSPSCEAQGGSPVCPKGQPPQPLIPGPEQGAEGRCHLVPWSHACSGDSLL